jgi:hypothetical protein
VTENSAGTIGTANIIVAAGTGLERGRGAKAVVKIIAVVNIVVKVTVTSIVVVKVGVRRQIIRDRCMVGLLAMYRSVPDFSSPMRSLYETSDR